MTDQNEGWTPPATEGDQAPAEETVTEDKGKGKDKPKKEKAPRDEQNGVVRPKTGTKTGRVWEISDEVSRKAGEPAPRKDVMDACAKEGINPATAATQYGRWRHYNGLKGASKPGRPSNKSKAEAAEAEAKDTTAEE